MNINFDDAPVTSTRTSTREVTFTETIPEVTDTLTVTRREERTTDVGKNAENWTWENLRDYVVREIERIHGEFPKDPMKLKAIFYSFHQRHGADAGPIAVAAFEIFEGFWNSAPIMPTRFCKGSDEWFAIPIKNRLHNP